MLVNGYIFCTIKCTVNRAAFKLKGFCNYIIITALGQAQLVRAALLTHQGGGRSPGQGTCEKPPGNASTVEQSVFLSPSLPPSNQ